MAYESMTYEFILQRMMDKVTEKYPNLDNREGSIIFNALAPAAIELAIMYTELNNVLSESFVTTASREYLLIACEQMGIDTSMFEATAGVHRGDFNVNIPIGSRWNCGLYNYVVTEYMGVSDNNTFMYKLMCETEGSAPNNTTGDLIAISDYPEGLSNAELTECLVEGENEISDDGIREVYINRVNNSSDDGNVNQYARWCSEYDGIGNYKIFPLWNGDNTVKVSILSPSNLTASEELVAEFQEYIDPGVTGMGDGVAPIGAFVTVTTATEVPINVSATVKLKDGYDDTSAIDEALTKYFASVAYNKTLLPYMNVGASILTVDGVEFIADLTVNGSNKDITLGAEEIPVLGTTDWTVS
jgi:uncharacterized phage protein gp47/JayE